MLKDTFTKIICTVVFGIFLIGLYPVAALAEKEFHHVYSGTNKMIITIENEEVTDVQCVAPNQTSTVKKCFEGLISNLKLVDTKGTAKPDDDMAAEILDGGMPDGMTIRSDDFGGGMSPGCTWFLWRGKWYLICD